MYVGDKMNEELIEEAFEQHWLHGRHVENERLWFTTIYGAITAAIYTILGQSGFDKNLYPLLISHIILSVFGLVVALKLSAEFHRHNEIANKILEEYNPEFALRPIERSRPQGVVIKSVRQIFTVKNSFFQLYVLLILSSVTILITFYSEIFPSYLKFPISMEWVIVGLLVLIELSILIIYAVVLNKRIYYAKCVECNRVIRFDKPLGVVECTKCGNVMKKSNDRYACDCGYSIRFEVEKAQVICENKDEHEQRTEVSNTYRRLV